MRVCSFKTYLPPTERSLQDQNNCVSIVCKSATAWVLVAPNTLAGKAKWSTRPSNAASRICKQNPLTKRPFRLMHLIKSEDITQTVVLRSHCEASHEHQQHYSSLTISSFSNVSLSTAYVQLLEKNWQRNGVACTSWLRLSSQIYDKG